MVTRRERLRRVAILCFSCTRNIAYYRAGRHEGQPIYKPTLLLATISNNFLDMAVLEWCKLFDRKEQHSWRNVVGRPDVFVASLASDAGVDASQLEGCWKEMRTYRDKFLAHLDSERMMHPPRLDVPKCSVAFYYSYLLTHENDGVTFEDGPSDLVTYYNKCSSQARQSLYELAS